METNSTMTMGCDLGDRKSTLCMLDARGDVVERRTIASTVTGFRKYFERVSQMRVVIEVGGHSRWVSELLKGLGHDVIVANARKLKLIYADRDKDDHIDAEKLARLGRVDVKLLAPIEHRSRAAQADLALIRIRDVVVRARTAHINAVRGICKSFGCRLPSSTANAFAKKIKASIPDELAPALLPLLNLIEQVSATIRGYDKAIEQTAETAYPDAMHLRAIDGVGPLTSLAFILTLDDAQRFKKSRQVGAFLGLCPRRRQSGQMDQQCRISRAGDGFLRKLLVNCAHHILGPFGKESDLRTWGLRLAERGGPAGKKRAVVALARRLAVLMHRLWTTGEIYQPINYSPAA